LYDNSRQTCTPTANIVVADLVSARVVTRQIGFQQI
jgi:hypothetical protein